MVLPRLRSFTLLSLEAVLVSVLESCAEESSSDGGAMDSWSYAGGASQSRVV